MMLALLLSLLLPPAPPQLPGGSFEENRSWSTGWTLYEPDDIAPIVLDGEPAVGYMSSGDEYTIVSDRNSVYFDFSAQLSFYDFARPFPEDRDGDGCPEILVIDDTSQLSVWDESAYWGGTMLFSVIAPSPFNALPVADYDADGITDIFAINDFTRDIVVLSGADGSTLVTLPPPGGGSFSSSRYWVIEDIDGDGARDVAIVYSDAAYDSYLLFLSGMSYAEIGSIPRTEHIQNVLSVGDLDGDGVDDVAVAMTTRNGAHLDQGAVVVLSGATLSELFTVWGSSQGSFFGEVVDAASDWTGDGVPDFWATDRNRGLIVVSGRDQTSIPVDVSPGLVSNFISVKQSGDWTGDGVPDLLIVDSSDSARVRLLTHNPCVTPYGSQISVSSGGLVSLDVDFPDAYWGAEYRVLFSLQPPQPTWFGGIYLPLASDPLLMRTLFQADYSFMPYQLGVTGFLDPQGDAFVSFGHPGGLTPKAVGHSAYGCVLVGPPASPELTSSAFAIEFVP